MNNVFTFSGTNYAEVTNNANLEFKSAIGYTIMCWMKTKDTSSMANYTGLFVKADEPIGTKFVGWQLLTYDNCIAAEINVDKTEIVGPPAAQGGLVGTMKLNDAQWHNVAVTVDCKNGKAVLYVDGKAEKESSHDGLKGHPNSDAPALIGVERNKDYFFTGQIGQVNLWDRVLSADELAILFNAVVVNVNQGTILSTKIQEMN